jgi:hypothetical protein
MEVASAAEGFDRWIWWPTAGTVAMVAVFVFVGGMPGPLNALLFLLAVVACPGVTLLLIGRSFALFRQQRPRGAVSALLAVAVPVLLLVPMGLMEPYVHLGLMLTFGIGYLGSAPHDGEPVGIYDWSTGMVGGPNTFLIHDTTDAVALPDAKSDLPAWRNTDFLRKCAGKSQHLIGHYYVCID